MLLEGRGNARSWIGAASDVRGERPVFQGRGAWVKDLHARCEGGHVHEVLQGSILGPGGVRRNRTANAAEYDASFCDSYLKLVGCRMSCDVDKVVTAS